MFNSIKFEDVKNNPSNYVYLETINIYQGNKGRKILKTNITPFLDYNIPFYHTYNFQSKYKRYLYYCELRHIDRITSKISFIFSDIGESMVEISYNKDIKKFEYKLYYTILDRMANYPEYDYYYWINDIDTLNFNRMRKIIKLKKYESHKL